ncbi:MAG: RHS repeat-associated core domain-containing protein, partial [Chryseobacterium sp.]
MLMNLSASTALEPGFVVVYVDNQTIGKDVWFDNVQILHYNTRVLEENHYYPFGLTVSASAMGTTEQPLKYQGKELENSFGLEMYDFTARMYDPQLGRTWQPDPLANERVWVSPYSWVQNNPISRIDPTGASDEPVYTSTGNYRGHTEEGFTGDILIYDGNSDFKNMTKDELLENTKNEKDKAQTYDEKRNEMKGTDKAKIWTHVLEQLEGTMINGVRFSMSMLDTKVWYAGQDVQEGAQYNFQTDNINPALPLIKGTDLHTYETTVENIQSTLFVHEWYTHGILKQGSFNNQHYKAYQNVITHPLWQKTTERYKMINVGGLKGYYERETGKPLDGIWLKIYNT